MSRNRFFQFAFATIASSLLFTHPSQGVDFHAFEFNGGSNIELFQASNTGTIGGATWDQSNSLTQSRTDGSGNFAVKKFNDAIANNYLQIDNIDESTVGSRYIVVRMSGWDFFNNVPGEGEEIRFDFLNDDTGTSDTAVTAQVRIDRNPDGPIELRGTANGVGSEDIANRATLNTTQTEPFTMVLELNKTSNTYEIFYKDDTNPSQSLGSAPVRSEWGGNSIRFTVNNNFGSTLDEFFSIDRIALSDENPLTDLMTLEIDRISGAMTLKNTTGSALSGLRSYSITSRSGALNATNWKSVTDNYDQAPQNGSVDNNGAWTKTSTTTTNLSEAVAGGDGGNLSNNQTVVLSQGSGPWIKSPVEDLEITLNFDGGISRKANVNFVGNDGKRFQVGDLTFDGMLTTADWTAFNLGGEQNLAGMTPAQAYQAGDFNGDGTNDIFDFNIFKTAYVDIHGLPAFEAMIAGVPEPSTVLLLATGSLLLLGRRLRSCTITNASVDSEISEEHNMIYTLKPACGLFLTVMMLSIVSTQSRADILEEFLFDEANNTTLENVNNTGTGGNLWFADDSDINDTTVLNGKLRIRNQTQSPADAFLQIDNITTGRAWIVTEFSGWSLNPNVGEDDFNASELEEIRLAFLENDSGTSGSTITGQYQLKRNAGNGLELVGQLLTGGPDFEPLALNLSRSTPFHVALEINEIDNTYSVYYKDDSAPYVLLGTSPHVSTRDGNSIRFRMNNSFAGTGEFVDIDRIYLTDSDPTNVNLDRLTLQVDAATGLMQLTNDTATTIEVDAYTITSSTLNGELNFGGWDSLNDRVPLLDAVDGPDGGATIGDGAGETWDEAPGSSNKVLAERFLLGKSVFAGNASRTEMLGNAFKVGGDINSLTFQYRNADTGAIETGNIVPTSLGTSADFDGDGDVDGRDFLVWQRGGTTPPLSSASLAAWQAQYDGGALKAASQAVPEPVSLLLVGVGLVGLGGFRSRR